MAVDTVNNQLSGLLLACLLFEPAESLAYWDGERVQTNEGSLDLERA